MPDPVHPPATARVLLAEILSVAALLEETHPTKASQGLPLVLRALEITTNVYRRVGATSGQLQSLEQTLCALSDLV